MCLASQLPQAKLLLCSCPHHDLRKENKGQIIGKHSSKLESGRERAGTTKSDHGGHNPFSIKIVVVS